VTANQADHISTKLQSVLRPHLRFLDRQQPIPRDENLGKLGLDSMAAINLLLDLEQAFNIKIPDSLLTAETFETAASLEESIRPLVETNR
jgi:acyl carrier protein